MIAYDWLISIIDWLIAYIHSYWFIIIDDECFFFCFLNTTLHHFVTLISLIEFHHFSWDLRGARRPLTWRTGEFPATAGETHPPGSGWLQMSKFPKSLQVSDDLWSFFFFWSFDEVFIWCWEITISGISLLWLYLGFMMIYENIEGLIGRRRTWARSLDRNGKAISPDLPNGHVEHWLCVYRMWWQILDLSDTILGWRLDG